METEQMGRTILSHQTICPDIKSGITTPQATERQTMARCLRTLSNDQRYTSQSDKAQGLGLLLKY